MEWGQRVVAAKQAELPSVVMLDSATVRGAVIALGLLDSTRGDPRANVKVFDVQVAAAETFIESIVLHDRVIIPKLHADYPALDIVSDMVGDVTQAAELPRNATEGIEAAAVRAFRASGFASPPLIAQLRRFAGVDADRLAWDRVMLSYYGGFEGLVRTDILDQALTLVDVPPLGELARVRLPEHLREMGDGLAAEDVALLWLTWRTFLYDQIALFLDVPYVPHPSRTAIWKAVNLQRLRPTAFHELPIDLLTDARLRVAAELHESASWQVYDITVPPLLGYALRVARSSDEVLPVILKLRSSSGARELRAVLKRLGDAAAAGADPGEVVAELRAFHTLAKTLAPQDPASPSPSNFQLTVTPRGAQPGNELVGSAPPNHGRPDDS
jgi:hypothetical protein